RIRAIVCAVALLVTTAAGADMGPALSVPDGELAAALTCPSEFTSDREPILLVHGTAVTAEEHWGWNYANVLPALGFDVCLVHLPDREMSDLQVSSASIVYAIRKVARDSGKEDDVHSPS